MKRYLLPAHQASKNKYQVNQALSTQIEEPVNILDLQAPPMAIQEQLTLINKFPCTQKAVLIEASAQKINLNEKLDLIKAQIESAKNLPKDQKEAAMKSVSKELQELRAHQISHVKDSFDFMHGMSAMVNEQIEHIENA